MIFGGMRDDKDQHFIVDFYTIRLFKARQDAIARSSNMFLFLSSARQDLRSFFLRVL